jgi:hypothetical protein
MIHIIHFWRILLLSCMNHDDSRGLNIKCFQIYYKCKNDDVKCFKTSHHIIQIFFPLLQFSIHFYHIMCKRYCHNWNEYTLFKCDDLISHRICCICCTIVLFNRIFNKRICYVTCGNLISSLISVIMYNLKGN